MQFKMHLNGSNLTMYHYQNVAGKKYELIAHKRAPHAPVCKEVWGNPSLENVEILKLVNATF